MDDVPSPQNDLEVQKYGAYDLHVIHLHRYLNAHFKQEINKYKSPGNSVQYYNQSITIIQPPVCSSKSGNVIATYVMYVPFALIISLAKLCSSMFFLKKNLEE
jgi:hypothetical protein